MTIDEILNRINGEICSDLYVDLVEKISELEAKVKAADAMADWAISNWGHTPISYIYQLAQDYRNAGVGE